MTAAERVTMVTAALMQDWRTLPELAQALRGQNVTTNKLCTSAARWALQQLARRQPVFSRRRNVRLREYRIFPAAVQVRWN